MTQTFFSNFTLMTSADIIHCSLEKSLSYQQIKRPATRAHPSFGMTPTQAQEPFCVTRSSLCLFKLATTASVHSREEVRKYLGKR